MTTTKDMDVFKGKHGIERMGPLETYIMSLDAEPHASRRKEIIAKHPEIRQLMGHETLTKWIVLALVVLQLACAWVVKDDGLSSWRFWILSYVVGGTTAQALALAMHEVSHFLAFKKLWHNKALLCFINVPMVLPSSITFRNYHLEHHKYQGVEGVDMDVPLPIEQTLLSSTLGKLFFVTFQLLFYAIRPVLGRMQVFSFWHGVNYATCVLADAIIVYTMGWGAIAYLTAGMFFSGSLHPMAAHFIAEHYVFLKGYETYSYYGPLNKLAWNVGYHNEHHDFPNVPWTRLPMLRQVAAEYYDNLPQHDSWPMVIWHFITDKRVSGYSRVQRPDKTNVAQTVCGDRATNFPLDIPTENTKQD